MRQTIQFLGRVTEVKLALDAKEELLERSRNWKAEAS
jgi:hypothetical protein